MDLKAFFDNNEPADIQAFLDEDTFITDSDDWELEYLDNLDEATTILD